MSRQFSFTLPPVIAAGVLLCLSQPLSADPCGMVPPIDVPLVQGETKPPIVRVGAQMTYVFYKNGIETFVIRPGFEGRIDEFGMLIPFPAPPEIRKVPEEIFAHVAAAIDPPEVELDLRPQIGFGGLGGMAFGGGFGGGAGFGGGGLGVRLKEDEVRVVREEAVGMYEVAVLEAGSAAALKKWMDEHGYRFPTGMDNVCNDYVRIGWGFVAVKTRVGWKAGVDPKPGMRKADPNLPSGAAFDGHVQAMGFRFRSRRLEVPMRLSAFNEGELHNIVYLLSDEPAAIRSIGINAVVRQVPGIVLKRNLTEPLPVRLIGAEVERGRITNLTREELKAIKDQRDPAPKNGLAGELIASDLLAVRHNRLSHPHEEAEKNLQQISDRFGLRGGHIEELHRQELAEAKREETADALDMLHGMTLTVIDGDFPRDVLARENLTFFPFRMRGFRNSPRYYDAKTGGPAKKRTGLLLRSARLDLLGLPETLPADVPQPRSTKNVAAVTPSPKGAAPSGRPQPAVSARRPLRWAMAAVLFSGLMIGLVTRRRRQGGPGSRLK